MTDMIAGASFLPSQRSSGRERRPPRGKIALVEAAAVAVVVIPVKSEAATMMMKMTVKAP